MPDQVQFPDARKYGRTYLVLSGAVVLAITVAVILIARRSTAGHLVYSLDDAYIHLSIGRNLASTGTWGINPGEFAGASSSPLWTLLVAGCFKLIGPREIVPLALNFAAAIALLWSLSSLLRRYIPDPRWAAVAILAIALAVPLPMLVISGMEHTLQLALTFALIAVFARCACQSEKTNTGLLSGALLSALLVATRFEGLFLVFSACVLMAWRGKWRAPLTWGLAAALPVAAYAAYSLGHGGAWLPNSVLIKGNIPPASADELAVFVVAGLRRVAGVAILCIPVLTAVLLWALLRGRRDNAARECRFLLELFVLTAFLHGQFAAIGWFSRYEAHLIGMGSAAICASIATLSMRSGPAVNVAQELPQPPATWIIAAIVIAFAAPMSARALVTLRRDCLAPGGIYGQQCQMAFFVRDNYAGRAVALNDIGVVSWYGNARVIDLMGLANSRVFRARRDGKFNAAFIDVVCRDAGADLAIVYPEWFEAFGGLPGSWREVGSWTTPNNVAAASATVHFYATSVASESNLARRFEAYSKRNHLAGAGELRSTVGSAMSAIVSDP